MFHLDNGLNFFCYYYFWLSLTFCVLSETAVEDGEVCCAKALASVSVLHRYLSFSTEKNCSTTCCK